MKKRLLFVTTQFFKGGAELNLLNLLRALPPERYEADLLLLDQAPVSGMISLVPQLPSWVRVFDAAQGEGALTLAKKAYRKVRARLGMAPFYRRSAVRAVRGRQYDFAFTYGEWVTPEFVAREVSAAHKAVWIHTDLEKAPYIHPDAFFRCDAAYRRYLFVSRLSLEGACRRFPQMRGRAAVIHNLCDEAAVQQGAKVPLTASWPQGLPVILTVANLRTEKNHLRQVEAMHLLQEQGLDFVWINVGSTANPLLLQQVTARLRGYGLQHRFLLRGADDNPYRYMARADAVAVLSDFESWSLVITEAKVLGVPVIATRTSGALEQLEDGRTGLLCGFSAADIAQAVSRLLRDTNLRDEIRKNLRGFSAQRECLADWESLMGQEEKDEKAVLSV